MNAALSAFLADGRLLHIRYGGIHNGAELHVLRDGRSNREMDVLHREVCEIAAAHGWLYNGWETGSDFDGEIVYLKAA
jgi:hypothetical protein